MRAVPLDLEEVREGLGVHRGWTRVEAATLSTGFPALNQYLGGGWPDRVFTELRLGRTGIGEMRLLMPALSALSRQYYVLWVAPPYRPYAPALVAQNMVLNRLLLARPRTHKEALWAVSQGLLCPSIGAVVSWFSGIREGEFRGLQRRASEGSHWSFCFLPESATPQPSHLRLALQSTRGALRIRVSQKAKRPLPPLVVTL